MTYESALITALDFRRKPDSVDEQFRKIWPNIYTAAAAHERQDDKTVAVVRVAGLLFEAWYRSIYYKRDRYGGTLFAHPNENVLHWLRLFCSQFLALRDVEHQHWDAENLCSMMRADKEARVLGVRSVLFYRLPFDGIMSWDLSNMLSACSTQDSLFFASTPVSQWRVKATNEGTIVDLASRVEVVNIQAIISRERSRG